MTNWSICRWTDRWERCFNDHVQLKYNAVYNRTWKLNCCWPAYTALTLKYNCWAMKEMYDLCMKQSWDEICNSSLEFSFQWGKMPLTMIIQSFISSHKGAQNCISTLFLSTGFLIPQSKAWMANTNSLYLPLKRFSMNGALLSEAEFLPQWKLWQARASSR